MSAFFSKAVMKDTWLFLGLNVCFRPVADIKLGLENISAEWRLYPGKRTHLLLHFSRNRR